MKLNNLPSNRCSVQLMTVDNNDEGRSIIKSVRKQMKGSPIRLVLRGRGSRPNRGFQAHLPLSLSSKISVYVTNRKPKTPNFNGLARG